MIRLRILGRVELSRGDGGLSSIIPEQPKLLALTSYLAATRHAGPQRRDTLLALLWPELDTRPARHALSQALTVLRAELGHDVVGGRYRDPIELDTSSLWCDVVAFRDALRAGRNQEALELYGGALLDGFFLPHAPEFERWLEDERRTLHRAAGRAARELAARATAAGESENACRWARRGLELDPYEEASWRQLIRTLDENGDRAGAMAEFQRMARQLERELGVEPSPETVQLIEAVKQRGSRGGPPARTASVQEPARATYTDVLVQPPAPPAESDASLRSKADAADADDSPRPAAPMTVRRFRRRRLVVAAFGIVALVAAAGWNVKQRLGPAGAANVDPGLIAVLPFHVSDATGRLTGTGDAVADLLELRLELAGELRATVVRPDAPTNAAPAAAGARAILQGMRAPAIRTGAGAFLSGTVVALPDGRMELGAALHRTRDGALAGRARVVGSADSLPALVDGLAAQLLGLVADEDHERLDLLGSTPLPAVQSYLAGRTAERTGRHIEAARAYDQALQHDPSFVPAAVRLLAALSWAGEVMPAGSYERALSSARLHQHRLGPRDRLRARAYLGVEGPATSVRRQIDFLEHTVAVLPDEPEMWYQLGDLLLHQAALSGVADWRERSVAAFERALRIDPGFLPAVIHRYHLALDVADTARALALVRSRRRLVRDGTGAVLLRWAEAILSGDSAALTGARRDFDTFDEISLSGLTRLAESFGIGVDDAERAHEVRLANAASAAERERAARGMAYHFDKRGRPAAAARARMVWRENAASPRGVLRNFIHALMADGDPAAAAEAARSLAAVADQPLSRDATARVSQLADICAVGLWRMHARDLATLPRMIASLRTAAAPDPDRVVRDARICAATLEVALEATRGLPSREAVVRFDSILTDLPFLPDAGMPQELRWGNLLSARLWLGHGDAEAALRAVQRRSQGTDAVGNPISYLRMECDMALALRRDSLARSACERFLALRADADPHLQEETERVRRAYESVRRRSAH